MNEHRRISSFVIGSQISPDLADFQGKPLTDFWAPAYDTLLLFIGGTSNEQSEKMGIHIIRRPTAQCNRFGVRNEKQETTKVRIGEVTRSIFYAPQYVALSQGFFKDEGLDVELTTTPGGDKTMTALLSNAIDVALVGSETSIYVSQQGSDDPVINFAQLTQTDGTFLVARKKVDKFDWNSLKGLFSSVNEKAACLRWQANSH